MTLGTVFHTTEGLSENDISMFWPQGLYLIGEGRVPDIFIFDIFLSDAADADLGTTVS